jgi:hypothetical protein
MVCGRQLLYLHVDDDQLAETLVQFTADIVKSLPEDKG